MVVKIVDEPGRHPKVSVDQIDLSSLTLAEAQDLARLLEEQWGPLQIPGHAIGVPGVADVKDSLVRFSILQRTALQRIFVQRSIGALTRAFENVSEETLVSALAAPSDMGALARVLATAAINDASTRELDPYAAALARNAEHRERLLMKGGGALSAERAGQVLGITRQAVDKRRANKRLLAVKQAGDWRYPAFQFEDEGLSDATKAVIETLDDPTGWSALEFLLTPDTVLDGHAPSEVLKLGPEWQEKVLRVARASKGDGFA